MSTASKVYLGHVDRYISVFLAANLAFWIYFWIAFAKTAEFDTDHINQARSLGDDIYPFVYTFWGYTVHMLSPGQYLFMRLAYCVEFPAFLLVTLIENALIPWVTEATMFAGISESGYKLIAVMSLSFGQWYLIAKGTQKLWKRYSSRLQET